jgi:hypothetical protein
MVSVYELVSCSSEEKPDVGSCEHGTETLGYTKMDCLESITFTARSYFAICLN